MPEEQIVNGKFYKEMLAWVYLVRSEFQKSGLWYLQHDKEPAYSSGVDLRVISSTLLPQFSAGFLFPKLKIAMKGTRFDAVSSSQQTVKR
jgi:hypothetical protein